MQLLCFLTALFISSCAFGSHSNKELVQLYRDKKVGLDELQQMATDQHNVPLLYAVKATRKIQDKVDSKADFLQAAFFIETELKQFASKEEYYLTKDKTGLAYTLEYDPDSNAVFVILEGKNAVIGQGKKKVVTKAIHYSHKNPKIVARAEQSISMRRELAITKHVKEFPGIFETLGFGSHKAGKTKYTTIYSKLYSPGSLEVMFERGYDLTLYEKVRIALNILKGLEALHKEGIVHRDLGARNYLVHIPKGKPGKRDIQACIADLGRADFASNAAHSKVQGNTTYTAPEAIFLDKMLGEHYFKSDVFAVGCVFYRLIHGKKGNWQDNRHVKAVHIPAKQRYNEKMHHLIKATRKRRKELAATFHRSNKEEFEYIVLGMLQPYPAKRQSARSACLKMQTLFDKLS